MLEVAESFGANVGVELEKVVNKTNEPVKIAQQQCFVAILSRGIEPGLLTVDATHPHDGVIVVGPSVGAKSKAGFVGASKVMPWRFHPARIVDGLYEPGTGIITPGGLCKVVCKNCKQEDVKSSLVTAHWVRTKITPPCRACKGKEYNITEVNFTLTPHVGSAEYSPFGGLDDPGLSMLFEAYMAGNTGNNIEFPRMWGCYPVEAAPKYTDAMSLWKLDEHDELAKVLEEKANKEQLTIRPLDIVIDESDIIAAKRRAGDKHATTNLVSLRVEVPDMANIDMCCGWAEMSELTGAKRIEEKSEMRDIRYCAKYIPPKAKKWRPKFKRLLGDELKL